MKAAWRSIVSALRFLTILPIPADSSQAEAGLARAFGFFPLAGAVIGALLVGIGCLADAVWPPIVRPVVLVVAWGMITGGLHLDGLADTFDAVMSWRPRERQLEIMRDSRIGTQGVLALIGVLSLKAIWIGAANSDWIGMIWLSPILGRWAMVYAIGSFPPARTSGLGHNAQSQIERRDLLGATALALVLALVLKGAHGVLALGLVWAATHLLAGWWVRSLGGLTGDTYGALCELSEVIGLATLSTNI